MSNMKLKCITNSLKSVKMGGVYSPIRFDVKPDKMWERESPSYPVGETDLQKNFIVTINNDFGNFLRVSGHRFVIANEKDQKRNYRKGKKKEGENRFKGVKLSLVYGHRIEARIRKILSLIKEGCNDDSNFRTSEVLKFFSKINVPPAANLAHRLDLESPEDLPEINDGRLINYYNVLSNFQSYKSGNIMDNCGTEGFWRLGTCPYSDEISYKISFLLMEITALYRRGRSEENRSVLVAITHTSGSDWWDVFSKSDDDFLNEWEYIEWFNSNTLNKCILMYKKIEKEEFGSGASDTTRGRVRDSGFANEPEVQVRGDNHYIGTDDDEDSDEEFDDVDVDDEDDDH